MEDVEMRRSKVQRLHDACVAVEMRRSKVQRLHDACVAVFSSGGGLPTLNQLRWLRYILDSMEPIDVGIEGSATAAGDGAAASCDGSGDEAGIDVGSGDERSSQSSSSAEQVTAPRRIVGRAIQQITYIHIHECCDFSIGVFCFPAGARLPLHDHPQMVVLTKVLYGSVALKSYDWVINPGTRLAKIVSDGGVLGASSEASVLFPKSGGNVHSITALTPCAILDVLAPPYSEEQGRPSTYYLDITIPCLPGFAVLEETEMPDDLHVAGAPYAGPELVWGT